MELIACNTLLSFVMILQLVKSNSVDETQHANFSGPHLVLRVPSDLKDHLEAYKDTWPLLTRERRQEEPLKQNPNPPGISGPLSTSPVIAPGVYSCGHQVWYFFSFSKSIFIVFCKIKKSLDDTINFWIGNLRALNTEPLRSKIGRIIFGLMH